ncbi:MAG: DNA polymerase III subunit epsilon [Bifidobacteriaceae bacterium]|nr:DNA polymerase III subunit epsilon [Bifidobacteriaceae bacterium]
MTNTGGITVNQFWPVLGFDTETTGVDPSNDRIVTAAVVWRQANGVQHEQTWLIDPGIDIPPTASAIHGITTDYARAHGQMPVLALEEIASVLASTDLPIVAFNASYDLTILEAELRRHGLPTLAERLGRPVGPVFDPLVLDRAVDRYRRGKRTLTDLVAHYQIPTGGRLHNAAEDVRCTIAVLDALIAANPDIASQTPNELHEWQVMGHREWATNFNQWLVSRGKPGDVNLVWP